MSDESMYIHRPIPRRPFELKFGNPTPPDEDDADDEDDYPSPQSSHRPYSLQDNQRGDSYLDPLAFTPLFDSKSRADSFQDLTSSTLSGIYTPSFSSGYGEEDVMPAVSLPRHDQLEESIYKLVRDRRASFAARRRASTVSGVSSGQGYQPASATSLALRTCLLFLLGMGYGALLLRLSTEKKWTSFPVDEILKTGYDGKYLAAWGLCGAVLGSLLPWFDGKWEEMFEDGCGVDDEAVNDEDFPGTDWALVMRGIGAFAGIVFAIRKVPWASTMQVSLTLAMANPLLWYLIDRSKTGFLMSAAVGLAGTILSLGLNPGIMPAPTGYASHHHANGNFTGVPHTSGSETLMLGGLATQQTIETGIWIISVLFCSCVCFGNIGRRLALNRSAAGRGRWGGLK